MSKFLYSFLVLILFGFNLSAGSTTSSQKVNLSCDDVIGHQLDAFKIVVNSVAEACQLTNRQQDEAGFPHCGTLCMTKFIRKIESNSIKVDASVSVTKRFPTEPSSPTPRSYSSSMPKSSSSMYGSLPYSMGGMGSYNREGVTFKVGITVNIPLGPTDTLECINPMFSQVVNNFSQTLITAPWVIDKFEDACSDL